MTTIRIEAFELVRGPQGFPSVRYEITMTSLELGFRLWAVDPNEAIDLLRQMGFSHNDAQRKLHDSRDHRHILLDVDWDRDRCWTALGLSPGLVVDGIDTESSM